MKKLYLVTIKIAANEKIYAIKMLRAFFPSLGLADAKFAIEKMLGQDFLNASSYFDETIACIAVTAEEYTDYWVKAMPDTFGKCRITNVQPMSAPSFYRPTGV